MDAILRCRRVGARRSVRRGFLPGIVRERKPADDVALDGAGILRSDSRLTTFAACKFELCRRRYGGAVYMQTVFDEGFVMLFRRGPIRRCAAQLLRP